ncbi:hypothetical protein [Streptomyces sp. NBC_00207]|uniref:hypothetical protein n=1 Tax=unclassified Streptomyces TaxID=2593676 RepID=UPI0028854EA5|nr:hypothetical protein [Streptomyces sp. DSM 41633]
MNRAAWAAGNYAWGETGEDDEDHPDYDPDFPPYYGPPSGETWAEVRAITDAMTAPTARLMLEPVIWALALWKVGAPLETVVLEQSGALPEEVQENLSTELYSAGWESVQWAHIDAADFGSPSHRRRMFMLASRYHYRRIHTESPLTGRTMAHEALHMDADTVIVTRANRKTRGGNGFVMGRVVPGITSKIRAWYKQDDPEFRFTLSEIARLVTLPGEGSRSSVCQQYADIVAPVVSCAVMGVLLGVPWLPCLERYLAEQYPNVHGGTERCAGTILENEHQEQETELDWAARYLRERRAKALGWTAEHAQAVAWAASGELYDTEAGPRHGKRRVNAHRVRVLAAAGYLATDGERWQPTGDGAAALDAWTAEAPTPAVRVRRQEGEELRPLLEGEEALLRAKASAVQHRQWKKEREQWAANWAVYTVERDAREARDALYRRAEGITSPFAKAPEGWEPPQDIEEHLLATHAPAPEPVTTERMTDQGKEITYEPAAEEETFEAAEVPAPRAPEITVHGQARVQRARRRAAGDASGWTCAGQVALF